MQDSIKYLYKKGLNEEERLNKRRNWRRVRTYIEIYQRVFMES